MENWIEVDKPFYEFACKPGMLIEVDVDGEAEQYLVGDINANGGLCECCQAFDTGSVIVLRYKPAASSAPPPHTAAVIAWAKTRISDIKALQSQEMAGWTELDELRMLEGFVGEWEL